LSQRVTYRSNRKGDVVSKETRRYDRFGRLAETRAGFGSTVTYLYDGLGRLSRQTVDDSPIEYAYTRCGQLAGKFLGGRANPDAAVEYEYANNGRIVARTANGVRQTFAYDKKGQLVAVRDADGKDVERYAYDKAGNMLRKTVNGKTTTFAFDRANQLVSSTCGGITTHYEYDAAGRLVKEGDKTYTYGYLDKVLSVTDGAKNYSYSYHPDGQLATANYGSTSESFGWDGLALIQRGDEQFVNEPHVGGGNPVASSKKATYFNDLLGTTVGQKTGNTYTAAALTAFGEPLPNAQPSTPNAQPFFTGKPQVEGLGYAFLMRNYRAGLAKWQAADPMGYPDGWNALAYCGNGVTSAVDLWGCEIIEEGVGHSVVSASSGLGSYTSQNGVSGNFSVYASGMCSHSWDNLTITGIGLSLAVGSTLRLENVLYPGGTSGLKGLCGVLEFSYSQQGQPLVQVKVGTGINSKNKYVNATINVIMELKFQYTETDENGQSHSWSEVIQSKPHVFVLKCSVHE
jgi:RHS repeat-associated protein